MLASDVNASSTKNDGRVLVEEPYGQYRRHDADESRDIAPHDSGECQDWRLVMVKYCHKNLQTNLLHLERLHTYQMETN